MTGQHQRWREASAAPAEQMDSASRCLACGLPITSEQQVFKIGGLVVHLRCAVYRRQLLRR
jgi:hypothetical protein